MDTAQKRQFGWIAPALLMAAFVVSTGACSPETQFTNRATDTPESQLQVRSTATPESTPDPRVRWSELVLRLPFAYATPLPAPERSAIDGTYVKVQPGDAPTVHCKRCPDYAREPGIWKLNFDRGSYRIYHPGTNFASVGSYTLSLERITLFNDPTCTDDVGALKWKLDKRTLVFEIIADNCAIELRGKNLASVPWQSCLPPNIEAGITDHWNKPRGCD